MRILLPNSHTAKGDQLDPEGLQGIQWLQEFCHCPDIALGLVEIRNDDAAHLEQLAPLGQKYCVGQHGIVAGSGHPLMIPIKEGLDIEHDAICHCKQSLLLPEIDGPIAVDECGQALRPRKCEKFPQKFRLQHAFAAGYGDSADKGNLLFYPLPHLFRRHTGRSRRTVMRTDMDAGIAEYTFARVKGNIPFSPLCPGPFHKCPCRTMLHAEPAACTHASGLGVVAIKTIDIAALQKDSGTVTRTIYRAEGYDLVYNSFHNDRLSDRSADLALKDMGIAGCAKPQSRGIILNSLSSCKLLHL